MRPWSSFPEEKMVSSIKMGCVRKKETAASCSGSCYIEEGVHNYDMSHHSRGQE